MYQKVTIIGNLGQEPETRFLQSGSSVCSFSIATNRRWTNSDGTPGEERIWWRASAWGKLGEICQNYLKKGQLVFLEGRMVPDRATNGPRVWTDQSGQPRAGYDLQVQTMKMLGRRTEYGDGYNQGYGQSQGRPAAPVPQAQQYGAPAQRQAPAPQRQAPAPQRQAPAAPQQYNAPAAQRQAPAQRASQPAARRDRRSTMSAPQTTDDDFGPDEIPF